MGKKNKDKKGKGKEKTVLKMEKKANKRAKKELVEKGEEDIEQLIAQFTEKDKCLTQVIEEKCPSPSPRSNMTLVAHPDREELIMFGGEYFTGNKMHLYNDLFFYNIRKDEWLKVTSPQPPPPRSSHQAVALAQGGGQMWMFGGEFSSHTQNQFYHYRDLWVLHLKDKKWEQIKSPGGPSARSGHRMVAFKKLLVVFGGFHESVRDYKYFNDVHLFDLETYTWSQIEPGGLAPSPRSGCVLFSTHTRLVLYGGYSKERVKRDVDKGHVHTDMYILQPEGKGEGGKPLKWRWQPIKQSGSKPSPRCGLSATLAPGNRGVLFGGVFDQEEDEEQLEGIFYNDLFSLDLDKGQWFNLSLRGLRQPGAEKKRRRKPKLAGAQAEMDEDSAGSSEGIDEAEESIESLALENSQTAVDSELLAELMQTDKADELAEVIPTVTQSEKSNIFTVKIGPQSSVESMETAASGIATAMEVETFMPSKRMKPCLAMRDGIMYMYGGLYEEGDKQVTLTDFYALDLNKLDSWRTIIVPDIKQEWQDSGSSSEDEGDEGRKRKDASAKMKDEEDDDDDDDDDVELTFDDAPQRHEKEELDEYFSRTQDYWLAQGRNILEEDGITLSDRKLLKFAKDICTQACGSSR